MEMGDHCGSLQEIINLTENLDCYEVYPDIHDYDDLYCYYIEELDVMQVPEHLQNYIDYESTTYGTLRWRKTAPSRIRAMCVIRVTVSMSITTVSAAVSPTSTG
ncbi:MAG: hypothetical protein ACLTIG_09945 [Roseburia hominis]